MFRVFPSARHHEVTLHLSPAVPNYHGTMLDLCLAFPGSRSGSTEDGGLTLTNEEHFFLFFGTLQPYTHHASPVHTGTPDDSLLNSLLGPDSDRPAQLFPFKDKSIYCIALPGFNGTQSSVKSGGA